MHINDDGCFFGDSMMMMLALDVREHATQIAVLLQGFYYLLSIQNVHNCDHSMRYTLFAICSSLFCPYVDKSSRYTHIYTALIISICYRD